MFEYELKIVYESQLRNDKLGFYKSSYKDINNSNGKNIWLAATQFAPTEARHGFPCYDEPKFKATFKLELIHSKELFAISNTEVENIEILSDKLSKTSFKQTPVMSTYLIGFIISDFMRINETRLTDEKISHSAYVRKNAVALAKFSAKYGFDVFTGLYNMLGEEISQPKEITEIKQILLPDFHFSGMENWGLITYLEQKLFYNKQMHSSKHLYNILYLMGHEMAHQWFGNSMTHEWWTYVWLKEGFATLYGYYGANNVYPHWNLMQIYQMNVLQYVFDIDDDPKIRPMTFYVEKQADIRTNYDRIAYEKSSCVLRMFDNALGDNIFKDGVNLFLNDRQFKSATEDHLFKALDESLKKNGNNKINILETFGNWTHQGGYPLVTFEIKSNIIKLRQERFLKTESFDSNDFIHSIWHIPINFEISKPFGNNFKNTTAKFWLKNREMDWIINNELFNNSKHWIIANIQQTGYYRVNYNEKNWHLIINALKTDYTQIHVANRAQLIDDAFHLAKIGRLDYNIVLSLLEYLQNEQDYAPWLAFSNGINDLKKRLLSLENSHLSNLIWNYIHNITEIPLKNFGLIKLSSELPSVSLTRAIIAEEACNANNTKCTNETKPYNTTDMRKIYYCEKLKKNSTDTSVFFEIKNLIRSSKEIDSQRSDYIEILGCTTNESILRILLLYTIQTEDNDLNLNENERFNILRSVLSKSRTGLKYTIEFVKKTWQKLNNTLCDKCLGNIIKLISYYIQTQNGADDFNALLGSIEIDSKSSNDAIQNVINNLQWNSLYASKIENWLEKYKYTSSGNSLFINFKLLLFIILTFVANTIYNRLY